MLAWVSHSWFWIPISDFAIKNQEKQSVGYWPKININQKPNLHKITQAVHLVLYSLWKVSESHFPFSFPPPQSPSALLVCPPESLLCKIKTGISARLAGCSDIRTSNSSYPKMENRAPHSPKPHTFPPAVHMSVVGRPSPDSESG